MRDNACSPEILRLVESLKSAVAKRRAEVEKLSLSLSDQSRLRLSARRNYSAIQYKLSRIKTKIAESERLIGQLDKVCRR